MPPKKDEAPKAKKKAELPKIMCGCGVNCYRAPPKGKKLPPQIEHNQGCSFQRATCNRYPHLPKCAACDEGCSYCCGINPSCHYCYDNKCKFQFKRDVLGWSKPLRPAGAAGGLGDMSPPGTAPRSA